MIRFFAVVALVWLALMPPFFTHGACTSEFDAVSSRLEGDQGKLAQLAAAEAYLGATPIPYTRLSEEQCRRSRPWFVEGCPSGTLIYASIPVKDRICRFYRDDSIKIQLRFDVRNRLERMQIDMAPYKSMPIPFTPLTLYWAK